MNSVGSAALKADMQSEHQKKQDQNSVTHLFNQSQRPPTGGQMTSPLTYQHPDDDHSLITNQHVFKVLVVGDTGCGKTSVIQRYCRDVFNTSYKATIGVDFALKDIRWNKTTAVRLQLWDIAGQERFGHMTRVYYKEALGAFIVFDVTRPVTFEAVAKWKHDIDQCLDSAGVSIPVVVLANKCDLAEEPIDRDKMDQFCQEHNCVAWLETSAKNNTNIDEAGGVLVQTMLELETGAVDVPEETGLVSLERRSSMSDEKKRSCAC
eukprot:TRINITY_DN9432_c0_g3_i1.p1 TRINITY_DN9432_c0_g3~~TRINITY_DN9432_c0_g3_i1.p1  ORF type:complete len:264 (+),score=103.24 TRINITY_DN9432_c0_g3_i1:624-1415(+)